MKFESVAKCQNKMATLFAVLGLEWCEQMLRRLMSVASSIINDHLKRMTAAC